MTPVDENQKLDVKSEKNAVDKSKEKAETKTAKAKKKRIDFAVIKKKALVLFDDMYHVEKTYSKITVKLISMVKVFIVATRKFLEDDCLTKASSIAYTTIVSLIPTLTVALTFYSVFQIGDKGKDELFQRIAIFMAEHNIRINIDPFLEALSSLIENAGKIGGVGAVVMVFSATAVLRTLEKSLDDIWKVKKSRPMLLKIIYYWAALTLGPLMLIAGTTVATQISTIFSSPNYNSVYVSDENKVWVVGNKAKILHADDAHLRFREIKRNRIDFDNQRILKYDNQTKQFREDETRIEELDFRKSVFKDIQFIDNYGWVVGDDGILLTTRNGGETWRINKIDAFPLNDIYMLNNKVGFIASSNGILLATEDSGKNWTIKQWPNVTANLNSITFNDEQGIITGDRGILINTSDGGKKWEAREIPEARKKRSFINLNFAQFVDSRHVCVVGNEGMILFSSDAGKTFKVRKFMESNYYHAHFISPKAGFVSGERGTLIHTDNGGENWNKHNMPTSKINKLIVKNDIVWAIGDDGLILTSKDQGKRWEGQVGQSFILLLLNFFAPFIFIWLLFLLAYIALPSTKVPFKAASIGAAFTGTVWVIFILLFIVYVKSFAKGTLAVYGALAAFPIFLLMIYASSVIILYGAEVSYTLMFPHLYKNIKIKAIERRREDIHIYYGLLIIHEIFASFEAGKGGTEYNRLVKACGHRGEEVDYFLDIFKKENIIIQNEESQYIPANASGNIKLSAVIDLIHDVSMDLPDTPSPIRKYLGVLLGEMKKSRNKIIGERSLRDLIENARA